jgi:hypothetical protein
MKIVRNIWIIVFSGLIVVSSTGCVANSAGTKSDDLSKPLPDEMRLKISLLDKYPLPDVPRLKAIETFKRTDPDILSFPISMATAESGRMYISDNNGQAIYTLSPDLASMNRFSNEQPKDKGAENLKYPNTIRFDKNKIFIADDDGIKLFGPGGGFEKLIRTFYSINDFSIDSAGSIFINPNFLDAKQDSPLIVKLGGDGARIGEFGKRPSPLENNDAEGKVFLDIDGPKIVAAYKRLPLVQIYDTGSGALIHEFEIKQPLFDELKKIKSNKEFVNPRTGVVVLPRYFAGVKILKDRVFLLLYLPSPEIVEVDFEGKELNRYRSDNVSAASYFGFDVRSVGGARQFIVGINDPSQTPTIIKFTQF